MKKTIFILTVVLLANFSFAQMSDKFINAMQEKIAMLDTTTGVAGLTDLANAFERIGNAEKSQWLPYYYAAYCHASAGLMTGNGSGLMEAKADKTDPFADKAETSLKKAEEMAKNNSEIFIVKKMIATLRMIGDPMNRYMTYGAQAAAMLEEAAKLNPDNPRIYLLQGQDKYYTPEQYGGSKDEAKVLFEKAQNLYDKFKPETNISPDWGRNQLKYFLSLYK